MILATIRPKHFKIYRKKIKFSLNDPMGIVVNFSSRSSRLIKSFGLTLETAIFLWAKILAEIVLKFIPLIQKKRKINCVARVEIEILKLLKFYLKEFYLELLFINQLSSLT